MTHPVPRLALLLFLHFFGIGALGIPFYSILTRHPLAGGLGFSGFQAACVGAAGTIAGMAAFLVVRHVEVSTLPRRWILACLYVGNGLVGTGIAFALPHSVKGIQAALQSGAVEELSQQRGVAFVMFCALCFGYVLFANSAMALLFAASLTHLGDDTRGFYRVRAMGTLGFIVAGLVLGIVLRPVSIQPIVLSLVTFFSMAGLCLWCVPEAKRACPQPQGQAPRQLLPAAREAGLGVLLLVMLCAVTARFFEIFAGPFLFDRPELHYPAAVQILAQSLEFFLLLAMPLLLGTWSHSMLLPLGPAGWICLYAALASAGWLDSSAFIYVGLPFQGFYCLFQTAAALHINAKVSASVRESSMSLLITLQSTGTLLGTFVAGAVVEYCIQDDHKPWSYVWSIACGFAIVCTLLACQVIWRDVTRVEEAASPETV